jgi:hypothetical protein
MNWVGQVNQWCEKVVGCATTTSYWLGTELVAVRDSAGPTVTWVHTDSLGSPAAWSFDWLRMSAAYRQEHDGCQCLPALGRDAGADRQVVHGP